uniref:Secreted protein n=1 Tax=Macrostomum lignano TaxID=282301 RepID=A0A1I8FCM6_9PLAT
DRRRLHRHLLPRQLAPLIYAGGSGGVSTFLSWNWRQPGSAATRRAVGNPAVGSLRRRLAERRFQPATQLGWLRRRQDTSSEGLADVAELWTIFVAPSTACWPMRPARRLWLPAGRPEFDCGLAATMPTCCCLRRGRRRGSADCRRISGWSAGGHPTAPDDASAGALNRSGLSLQHSTSESTGQCLVRSSSSTPGHVVVHAAERCRYLESCLGGQ